MAKFTPEISLYINRLHRIPIWIMVGGIDSRYEHTFIKNREDFRLALQGTLSYTEKVVEVPANIPLQSLLMDELIIAFSEYVNHGELQVCRRLHQPLLSREPIINPRTGKSLGRNFYFVADVVRSTLETTIPAVIVEQSILKDRYFADLEFSYIAPDGNYGRENHIIFRDGFKPNNQREIEIQVREKLLLTLGILLERLGKKDIIRNPNRRIGDQIWELWPKMI